MTQYPNQPVGAAPATPGASVSKTKWIVQLVIAVITMLSCSQLAIVAVIFSVLGLTKVDTDRAAAEKFYRWAWIAYIAAWVLTILLIVLLAATGILGGIMSDASSTSSY